MSKRPKGLRCWAVAADDRAARGLQRWAGARCRSIIRRIDRSRQPDRSLGGTKIDIGGADGDAQPHDQPVIGEADGKPTTPGPMIVIDPGHSGRYLRSIHQPTGLRDVDYPNYPEIYEMFDVSACLGKALRLDGYRVRLTKKHALDSVGLAERARIADDAKADLAVSVHDDHGQSSTFQATYDQRGRADAGGRYHQMYRGTGRNRTVFDHPSVARQSQAYAKIIAQARTRSQKARVTVQENNFTGRAPWNRATSRWCSCSPGCRGSTTRWARRRPATPAPR